MLLELQHHAHALDRAGLAQSACWGLQQCADKGSRAAAQEKKEDVPASQSNHVKRKLKSRNQSRKLDEVREAFMYLRPCVSGFVKSLFAALRGAAVLWMCPGSCKQCCSPAHSGCAALAQRSPGPTKPGRSWLDRHAAVGLFADGAESFGEGVNLAAAKECCNPGAGAYVAA